SVTCIEIDEGGMCTFHAPLRVVARCTLAGVSDIRMPVNSQALRLQAAGRRVSIVLPMNGLATFLSLVKAVHRQSVPALEESVEPLVCRTDARTLRFQVFAWVGFPVVASFVLWSWSNADHS